MAEVEDNRQYLLDNSPETAADMTRTDDVDLPYIFVAITGCSLVMALYGFFVGLVLIPLVVFTLLRRQNGRNFYRAWRWCQDRVTKLRKGVLWAAGVLSRTAPMGFNIRQIREFGLMHRRGSDSFVVEADGWDFSSEEVAKQYGDVEDLADVVKRVASSEPKFKIGVSPIHARLPVDYYAFAGEFGLGIHRDYLEPPPELMWKDEADYAPGEKRQMNLRKLAVGQAELVRDHMFQTRQLMVITIKHRGVLAAALKSRSLAEKAADRLPVIRMIRNTVTGLADIGIENPRVLSADELRTGQRAMRDVVHIKKHYEQLAEDRTNGVDTYALPANDKSAVQPDGRNERLWRPQQRMWSDGKRLVIDGTNIGVVEFTAMPKLSWPGQFAALDHLSMTLVPHYVRCYLSETMSSRTQERKISLGAKTLGDAMDYFGFDATKGRNRNRAEEMDRQLEVAIESGFTQQSMLFIIVLAPDEDAYNTAIDEVIRVGNFEKLGPKQVEGAGWLRQIVIAATTGIPT